MLNETIYTNDNFRKARQGFEDIQELERQVAVDSLDEILNKTTNEVLRASENVDSEMFPLMVKHFVKEAMRASLETAAAVKTIDNLDQLDFGS